MLHVLRKKAAAARQTDAALRGPSSPKARNNCGHHELQTTSSLWPRTRQGSRGAFPLRFSADTESSVIHVSNYNGAKQTMAGTQFKYQKPPNSSLIINYMFWAFSDGFNPSPPLHPQPEPYLLLRKEARQSQTCSAKSGVPQSSLRKYGQPHLTCCSLGPLPPL